MHGRPAFSCNQAVATDAYWEFPAHAMPCYTLRPPAFQTSGISRISCHVCDLCATHSTTPETSQRLKAILQHLQAMKRACLRTTFAESEYPGSRETAVRFTSLPRCMSALSSAVAELIQGYAPCTTFLPPSATLRWFGRLLRITCICSAELHPASPNILIFWSQTHFVGCLCRLCNTLNYAWNFTTR